MIKQFSIHGLHQCHNIDLFFESPCKVLLSENGMGKTTVLSALNSVLTHDVDRLRKIDFESIQISFHGQESDPLTITKDQLQFNWDSKAYDYFKRKLDDETFSWLIASVVADVPRRDISVALRKLVPAASHIALNELIEEKVALQEKIVADQFFSEIATQFKDTVLYLPTYRRIEENIANLGLKVSESKNDFINFGLSDVSERMKLLREEILQLSNTSFNSVSGDLLTKLINNTPTSEESRSIISQHNDLVPLILNRMGASLSHGDTRRILRSIENGEIFNKEYDSIAYFMARLIDAYQKQRHLDESLKRYAGICRDYFRNKEVIYDETRIQIDFFSKDSGKPIDFDLLSSGEKQIASLFAKIYLYGDRSLAILFDEPELSLSIEWQERLLSDLLESGRCSFLLAMTHSPFIFKSVVQYTSDMSKHISLRGT